MSEKEQCRKNASQVSRFPQPIATKRPELFEAQLPSRLLQRKGKGINKA